LENLKQKFINRNRLVVTQLLAEQTMPGKHVTIFFKSWMGAQHN